MANNKLNLQTPNVEAPAANEQPAKTNNKKGDGKNKKAKKNVGKAIAKFFRDVFSELKKVTWAKFRSTKADKGVLSQLGTVLVIVVIFIILITAMDLGLSKLLGLLIGSV